MLELFVAAATVVGTVLAGMQVWQSRRQHTHSQPPPEPPDASSPETAAPAPRADEKRQWNSALADNTPAVYEDFLDRWPDGPFAKEARDCFEKHTAGKIKIVVQQNVGDGIYEQQRQWLRPGESFRDDLMSGENWGPELVVVPAGEFVMGSERSLDPDGHDRDELPAHKVTIGKPFAAGKYPVTFDEWDHFHYSTGGKRVIEDEGWGAGRRPVMKVTWGRAQEYVERLSEDTDMPYRLLSEAEWEYCCRAGTNTDYSTGNDITTGQACFESDRTAVVGKYPPNQFGFHDMHGNVAEWCADYWHSDYTGAPADGSPWLVGGDSARVTRGGSWNCVHWLLRSRARDPRNPQTRSNEIGFRVARELTPPETN